MEEETNNFLDEELDTKEVPNFLNKQTLVGNKKVAKIKNIAKGNFDKPNITLELDGYDYVTDLNLNNQNFLVKNFGRKPRTWIGKKIQVSGENFLAQKGDKIVKGIKLSFSL